MQFASSYLYQSGLKLSHQSGFKLSHLSACVGVGRTFFHCPQTRKFWSPTHETQTPTRNPHSLTRRIPVKLLNLNYTLKHLYLQDIWLARIHQCTTTCPAPYPVQISRRVRGYGYTWFGRRVWGLVALIGLGFKDLCRLVQG